MKKTSTVFLQAVTVVLGIGALAILLWEPQLEGRNLHSTFFQIYFHDPFLVYVYVSSIAFFGALSQAFKLLGYLRREEIFSERSVKALRTIKYCATAIVAFVVGAEAYFSLVVRRSDDIAGGVMIGLFMIIVSTIVAATATVFERTLQSAVDLKSENDLTV